MRPTTRFTTRLLPTIRLARDPRRRWVAGIIVAGLTLFAIGVSWHPRPAEPALQPRISQERMGYIIITTTPAATWTPQPTLAPVMVFATVEVDRPVYMQVEDAPEAPPEPTAEPPSLDQSDPRCTGAADNTIAAGCNLTDAQRREAEQH